MFPCGTCKNLYLSTISAKLSALLPFLFTPLLFPKPLYLLHLSTPSILLTIILQSSVGMFFQSVSQRYSLNY